LAVATFLACAAGSVRAEEVHKKFRVGLLVGSYNTKDKAPSQAGNVLILTDAQNRFISFLEDPRNDSGVFNDLTIQTAPRATLTLSYAFTRRVLLEGSVGYQKGDVGNVEIQAVFEGMSRADPFDPFPFQIFVLPAGEMTQIPVQLTALVRFRPKSVFNPYLGLGVGYTFVGFDPSPELDELSRRMDASVGGQARIGGGVFQTINSATTFTDLAGASVDARDTFEWHGVGGVEYTFRKKWSAVAEIRHVRASRRFHLGFNGSSELGISIPSARVPEFDPVAVATYGPVQIDEGGLVDGGRLVPGPNAPSGFTPDRCPAEPQFCVFKVGDLDGKLDPGLYYVQGGPVKYGGFSFQVGVRYTF
jgi:hypothetical protein